MAIGETVGRLGATLLAMLHTRLELASVELEEESQRFLGYLVMALVALLLFGVALVLVALFIVVLFWDDHRLEAVGGLALAFGIGSAAIGFKLKGSIKRKPRFMASTVGELRKDLNMVRGAHE
jgi:uncharacterized membrane protein YqjE